LLVDYAQSDEEHYPQNCVMSTSEAVAASPVPHHAILQPLINIPRKPQMQQHLYLKVIAA
jgi:hypothetical protein